MKNVTWKKTLVSCLSFAAAVCCGVGVGTLRASAGTAEAPLLALENGAYCRLDTEDVSKSGLRFVANLDQTQWQTLLTAYPETEFSAGIIVVPTDWVEKAGGHSHAALDTLERTYTERISH